MKRPIKFLRHFFFDEECKKYSHSSEWGPNIGNVAFTSPSSNNFAYHYIDAQYTGRDDKNGVEIYEFDKLRDPDEEGYLLIVWNEDEARFKVHHYGYHMYFNEGGGEEFNNDLSCIDTDGVYMEDIYLYEVIGNAFKNVSY